jgi:hypothetical protein
MTNQSSITIVRFLFFVSLWLNAFSYTKAAASRSEEALQSSGDRLTMHLVSLSKIKVDGEIGRRIQQEIDSNLLRLDLAPGGLFLEPFQTHSLAGHGGQYGGFVGLGNTLDSLVRFGKYTADPQILSLKDSVFETLIGTQETNGYIGTFASDGRVVNAFDLHEMVYLIQALVDDYRYTGSQKSLTAATKLGTMIMNTKSADWIYNNIRDVRKLNVERAFIALGDATDQPDVREYGIGCMNLRDWQESPDQQQAYWFLNRCLAQVDLYRTEGDPKLLVESQNAISYLTLSNGMYVTGETGIGEQTSTTQESRGNTGETCATAYLIRLCHNLLQVEGNSKYGDIMERSIFNALFAGTSDDGRQLRYYTTIDGNRAYMNADTYCCPNNYRRIISELPEMVYYLTSGGFAVNLYTASSVKLDVSTNLFVEARQETDYPSSGSITLYIDPLKAATFSVSLRIPSWCTRPGVTVNGVTVTNVTSGTFLVINRKWIGGDVVRINLPMEIRLIQGQKKQIGKVAVMRGPMVFCLAPDKSAEFISSLRSNIATADAKLGGFEGKIVNLADIAGGGGGFGAGRVGNGVDPRSGKIVSGLIGQIWWFNANTFMPSADNPFINGLVIPNGSAGDVKISTTGLKVTVPATCGMANGFVMNGMKSVASWTTADGPEYGSTTSPMTGLAEPFCTTKIGGIEYNDAGHSILAIESNKAITYDLGAIREATGYQNLTFQTVIGYCSKPDPKVDVTIYVDGNIKLARTALTRNPLPVTIALDKSERFLTLMVTDQDGENYCDGLTPCDQVIFGDPVLVPEMSNSVATIPETHRQLKSKLASLQQQAKLYIDPVDNVKSITIDEKSFKVVKATDVRPDGIGLHVTAWSAGRNLDLSPDLSLLLTEFPNTRGIATYFTAKNMATSVKDELQTQGIP